MESMARARSASLPSRRSPPATRSEEHTSELQSPPRRSSDLRRREWSRHDLRLAPARREWSQWRGPGLHLYLQGARRRRLDRKSTRLNSSHLRDALPICDEGNGHVTISASRPPGVNGVNGEGQVCIFTFKALAAGD